MLLHHDYGFIPSRAERLCVVILQFDLQITLRSKTDSSVVDLEIHVDPCALPSREEALQLFQKSPLIVFLGPLDILESRTSKFVCYFALVIVNDSEHEEAVLVERQQWKVAVPLADSGNVSGNMPRPRCQVEFFFKGHFSVFSLFVARCLMVAEIIESSGLSFRSTRSLHSSCF